MPDGIVDSKLFGKIERFKVYTIKDHELVGLAQTRFDAQEIADEQQEIFGPCFVSELDFLHKDYRVH